VVLAAGAVARDDGGMDERVRKDIRGVTSGPPPGGPDDEDSWPPRGLFVWWGRCRRCAMTRFRARLAAVAVLLLVVAAFAAGWALWALT
jgi:hypothetical protein